LARSCTSRYGHLPSEYGRACTDGIKLADLRARQLVRRPHFDIGGVWVVLLVTDPIDIKPVVDRIFEKLRQNGSDLAEKRRAGLSPELVETMINQVNLVAPSELIDLYTYCDGTSTREGDVLGDIQFFPGFYWMNLDHALDVYRAISKSDEWRQDWLPVFANGGGDFYAVICDNQSPYFGEILGFVLGEPEQIVDFKSLFALFETIAQSFDEGAFFFSNERLTAKYPEMRAIARKVQPNFLEHEV